MAEGTLVNEHVIKLVGYAQRLEKLSFLVFEGLGTRILLASLPPYYMGFVMDFRMTWMNKTFSELVTMLKVVEARM
jgi:hypothetical protein